jgi:hypothetical protein
MPRYCQMRPKGKSGMHGATGLIDPPFRGINIYYAAIMGGQNGNNRYDTNWPRNDAKSLYSQNKTKNVENWRRRFHLRSLWICYVGEF